MRAPSASTRPLPPGRKPLPPGWSRASDPIYARVWRLGGLPGKPPPVYRVPMEPGMLGQQPHDSRAVWLNPRTANALSRSGIPSGRRDLNALNVLLHEYAHVGQAGPLRPQLLEGGADAWAASRYGPVARGLRWPRSTGIADMVPRPGYPQFMEPVARQGRGFVERGQFGRR